MNVSIVIPTCERTSSLKRLLRSVAAQKQLSSEVIIVDSGKKPQNESKLKTLFPILQIKYIHTIKQSVCAQRNIGIQNAAGEFVLLCDDDIEMPDDYLLALSQHIKQNPLIGAITGRFLQRKDSNLWDDLYPLTTMKELFVKFIFQQTVWGKLDNIKTNFITRPLFRSISSFYKRRGNTYSLAGWPIITQYSEPFYKTAFYSLGACLVKRQWLLDAPFDETLTGHGIGENYGIVLKFPEFPAIYVAVDTFVYHHQEQENRLPGYVSYQRRVEALHHFMVNDPRFNLFNRLFLSFSLVGNWLHFVFKKKKEYRKVTARLIPKVIGRKNLLWC